jgi:uncharacterized protein (DUF433 family)
MRNKIVMQLEDYFNFLDSDTIRIKGHRLGIEDLLDLYNSGYSPEQIALEFPSLTLEQIHATITYYWHNREEVDAYLSRLDKLVSDSIHKEAQAEASAIVKRMRQLQGQRMQPTL